VDYAPDPSNGREWVRKAFAPEGGFPSAAVDARDQSGRRPTSVLRRRVAHE